MLRRAAPCCGSWAETNRCSTLPLALELNGPTGWVAHTGPTGSDSCNVIEDPVLFPSGMGNLSACVQLIAVSTPCWQCSPQASGAAAIAPTEDCAKRARVTVARWPRPAHERSPAPACRRSSATRLPRKRRTPLFGAWAACAPRARCSARYHRVRCGGAATPCPRWPASSDLPSSK